MSKLFFDHVVDLSGVEKELKKIVPDKETQEELMQLIDEITHHRVLGCILDYLPEHHHKEFIDHIVDRPHDESILEYLKERIGQDITGFIRQEMIMLAEELLAMIKSEHKHERI